MLNNKKNENKKKGPEISVFDLWEKYNFFVRSLHLNEKKKEKREKEREKEKIFDYLKKILIVFIGAAFTTFSFYYLIEPNFLFNSGLNGVLQTITQFLIGKNDLPWVYYRYIYYGLSFFVNAILVLILWKFFNSKIEIISTSLFYVAFQFFWSYAFSFFPQILSNFNIYSLMNTTGGKINSPIILPFYLLVALVAAFIHSIGYGLIIRAQATPGGHDVIISHLSQKKSQLPLGFLSKIFNFSVILFLLLTNIFYFEKNKDIKNSIIKKDWERISKKNEDFFDVFEVWKEQNEEREKIEKTEKVAKKTKTEQRIDRAIKKAEKAAEKAEKIAARLAKEEKERTNSTEGEENEENKTRTTEETESTEKTIEEKEEDRKKERKKTSSDDPFGSTSLPPVRTSSRKKSRLSRADSYKTLRRPRPSFPPSTQQTIKKNPTEKEKISKEIQFIEFLEKEIPILDNNRTENITKNNYFILECEFTCCLSSSLEEKIKETEFFLETELNNRQMTDTKKQQRTETLKKMIEKFKMEKKEQEGNNFSNILNQIFNNIRAWATLSYVFFSSLLLELLFPRHKKISITICCQKEEEFYQCIELLKPFSPIYSRNPWQQIKKKKQQEVFLVTCQLTSWDYYLYLPQLKKLGTIYEN